MRKKVLGVKIDDITMDQAVETVEGWLSGKDKHYIVTTNPEFIVTAQEDSTFKKILNMADLSIPDGQGLKIGSDIECIISGVDFMEALCKMAEDLAFTVGFLGGGLGVAEKAAECLIKKYPGLKVSFISDGGKVDGLGKLPKSLKLPKTDILFVGFGHPKQEYWIWENLPKIPVKVAMGVGGSFDYISGKIPRAPKWVRNLGLEWLFRLVIQPWRIKRQIRLLKYVTLILWQRF